MLDTHTVLVLLACCTVGIEAQRRVASERALPNFTYVNIGTLLEYDHDMASEVAIAHAISAVTLGSSYFSGTLRLGNQLLKTVPYDSFHAVKQGPPSSTLTANLHAVCDAKHIPHIEIGWRQHSASDLFSISLAPPFKSVARATFQLALQLRWQAFTYVYDSDEPDAAGRAQIVSDVFTSSLLWTGRITLKRLCTDSAGDYRYTLKEIKKRGEKNVLVQCHHSRIHQLLKDLQHLQMLNQYFHYHFISLDLALIDLSSFALSGANITSFRIVRNSDANQQVVEGILHSIGQRVSQTRSLSDEERKFRRFQIQKSVIATETALMYDAVMLLAQALKRYFEMSNHSTSASSLSCGDNQTWIGGSTLVNFIKSTELPDALTGLVRFAAEGYRVNLQLQLLELSKDGLRQIGQWDEAADVLVITKTYNESKQEAADFLRNKVLRVTTLPTEPFVIFSDRSHDGKVLKGNERFKGYCIDVLTEIAKRLNFSYELTIVPDKTYGIQISNNTWNGIIRQLMDREADMAIAPLTITYEREEFVDFTKPFMNLGLSIMYRRPNPDDPDFFGFLKPLRADVWYYMFAAYIVVSFLLFVIARFTPYEWHPPTSSSGRRDSDENYEIVVNQFNLLNSFWFTVGSLMQQGCDISPRATSTRSISMSWWFFILIMISSYTANLAAFLTVERMKSPIDTVDDLANQNKIIYGTLLSGSTLDFFKNSNIDLYRRMWTQMNNFKVSAFVNSTEAGIERVKRENYAFILESTWLEYHTSRNCELMQVGGLLDSKGYGIGVPRDSKIRDLLSDTILQLQDEQFLVERKDYWWKLTSHVKCFSGNDKTKDANQLTVEHVGGIFIVLVIGLIISMVVAFLEYCWYARKLQIIPEGSLCKMMCKEFCLATKCIASNRRGKEKSSSSSKKQKTRAKDRKRSASTPSLGRSRSESARTGDSLPDLGLHQLPQYNNVRYPASHGVWPLPPSAAHSFTLCPHDGAHHCEMEVDCMSVPQFGIGI